MDNKQELVSKSMSNHIGSLIPQPVDILAQQTTVAKNIHRIRLTLHSAIDAAGKPRRRHGILFSVTAQIVEIVDRNIMKSLLASLLIAGCCYSAQAQSGTVGPNGPNGSNGTGSDAGRAYSNGNIPNPNEQTQNRPDSTLRSSDTTYMHQQWNGSSQEPNTSPDKRSKSKSNNSHKSGTPSKKKK